VLGNFNRLQHPVRAETARNGRGVEREPIESMVPSTTTPMPESMTKYPKPSDTQRALTEDQAEPR
jgi:hypothetical protein